MQRIRRDGVRVRVGPTGILSAYAALRAGSAIAVDGAGSDLDLDPRTGEVPSDFAVYCLRRMAGGAIESVESGLRYDHRAARITGTRSCD